MWSHSTHFSNLFDRATEKVFRKNESALTADIRTKIRMRAEGDEEPVVAEEGLVMPFMALFERMFIWEPGEYVVQLSVLTEPGLASFKRSYRFTLYESDSIDLRAHTEDYKFGGGFSYNVERHLGAFIPLSQHTANAPTSWQN